MTPLSFIFNQPKQRVRFGAGELANLAAEVEAVGSSKALVLCTPEQTALANRAAALLGDRCAGVFPGAVMHVPIEAARLATQRARELGADCAVAIGGGSTTGLGKAIALETDLPIVAVPTTYAGSEMTPIFGITEDGVKRTGRSEKVLPRSVLYDPELTMSLPPRVSAASGLNAIAHAVEGLYAADRNPITSMLAADGIRALAGALKAMAKGALDVGTRGEALYGAWLCGYVLGNTSMGLHHKLCHVLGGAFNLSHAELHSVVLPYVLAFNSQHAPGTVQSVQRALQDAGLDVSNGPAVAIQEIARANQLPISLSELGMPRAGIARAIDLATQNQYPNPRPIDRAGIESLLADAFHGVSPTQ